MLWVSLEKYDYLHGFPPHVCNMGGEPEIIIFFAQRAVRGSTSGVRPDLVQAIDFYRADLLCLSVSLRSQLATLKQTIEAVRHSERGRVVKILVGGRALRCSATPTWPQPLAPTAMPPTPLKPSPSGTPRWVSTVIDSLHRARTSNHGIHR